MVEKLFNSPRKIFLPAGVIDNLTMATPFESKKSGYTSPFCYKPGFISTVAHYCLKNITLYSAHSFRSNVQFYLEVFGLPVSAENTEQPEQFNESSIFTDQDSLPKKNGQRVFFHGRSNGLPTPLGIRAFQLARKLYPEAEIWFGVDHDKSSLGKNQSPFLNPQFRASCYLVPGIVDKIIYLHPPQGQAEKQTYWKKIYSTQDSLQPNVVVIPDDELNGIKKGNSNGKIQVLSFTDIFSAEEYALFAKIHQTNLKSDDVSPNDLSLAWEIIVNDSES